MEDKIPTVTSIEANRNFEKLQPCKDKNTQHTRNERKRPQQTYILCNHMVSISYQLFLKNQNLASQHIRCYHPRRNLHPLSSRLLQELHSWSPCFPFFLSILKTEAKMILLKCKSHHVPSLPKMPPMASHVA